MNIYQINNQRFGTSAFLPIAIGIAQQPIINPPTALGTS